MNYKRKIRFKPSSFNDVSSDTVASFGFVPTNWCVFEIHLNRIGMYAQPYTSIFVLHGQGLASILHM